VQRKLAEGLTEDTETPEPGPVAETDAAVPAPEAAAQ